MPVDFDPIRLGADVGDIVDHPMKQSQQALFHGFEMSVLISDVECLAIRSVAAPPSWPRSNFVQPLR